MCVLALPNFCQAQPQLQLSWAELVLIPIPPADGDDDGDDDDDDDDDTRNSTFHQLLTKQILLNKVMLKKIQISQVMYISMNMRMFIVQEITISIMNMALKRKYMQKVQI